jgi:hypothetical protein
VQLDFDTAISKKKRVTAPAEKSQLLCLGADTELGSSIRQYRRETELELAPSANYISLCQPALSPSESLR